VPHLVSAVIDAEGRDEPHRVVCLPEKWRDVMEINGVTCSSALLLIAVAALSQQPTGQTSTENKSGRG
jgi:hypothetical protein